MAMNNPYVNEDLKNISQMMMQAIQNVITGNIFGPRSQPTPKFAAGILDIAPGIYDLYGKQLGEKWLEQYMPAAGSMVDYPMRQAMQKYEEAMAPKRGVMMPGQELYSRYTTPQGQKTLPTQMQEASHAAWKLGQTGQWWNPMEGKIEMMPSTMRALAGMGSQYFGSAEAAQALSDILAGASDWSQLIERLPEDDPSRIAFESQYSATTQPTMKAITDVVSSVLRQHASQKDGAKPQEIKLEDALAGLAPQYFSRQEYLAGLEKYASEIISRIGLDAYNKLRTEAIRYVQGGPAPTGADIPGIPQQALRTLTELFGKKPPQTEPGLDLIGELLGRIR
jgi:hypothetical protein